MCQQFRRTKKVGLQKHTGGVLIMKPLYVPDHILNSNKVELYELIMNKSGQSNNYSDILRKMMQETLNESHHEGNIHSFTDRMLNDIAKERKFDAYGRPKGLNDN